MATYSILWKPSAVKDLRRIDRVAVPRILKSIEALSSDPFQGASRKLKGSEDSYRIRVGDYRVTYHVFKSEVIIEIIRVRHRREVYRK